MKNLILAIFFCFPLLLTAQTIRIADNNANAPAGNLVYPGVQEAIDAADPGDIIYVTPSPTQYPEISIDRQVTLYGISYNPETTFSYVSQIENIDILNKEASGTVISGIRVGHSSTDARFEGRITMGVDFSLTDTIQNITIEKCMFSIILHGTNTITIDGLKIINCITFNNTSQSINLRLDDKLRNAVVANNILQNFSVRSDIGIVAAGNFTVIKNNLFLGVANSNLDSFTGLANCLVTDNIFYGRSPDDWNPGNFQLNTFSNNITFAVLAGLEVLPPPGVPQPNIDGLGNQENVDPMFNNVNIGPWSFANDLRLMAGSPAIGNGVAGGDIGAHGWRVSNGTQ